MCKIEGNKNTEMKNYVLIVQVVKVYATNEADICTEQFFPIVCTLNLEHERATKLCYCLAFRVFTS